MRFISKLLLYSMVAALMAIVATLLLFKSGFSTTVSTYVSVFFLSCTVFFAIKVESLSQKPLSGFKNACFGGLIGLVAGCVYAFWFYTYVTVIDPKFLVNTLKTTQLYGELKAEGLDDMEIEKTMQNMTEIISVGLLNVITILTYTGIGFFSGMIFSFVAKKRVNKTYNLAQ